MTSTILASVILAAALAPGAVTLENRAMRIEFGDESEGFAVRRIVNRLAGDRAFVGDAKDVPRFWMLRFVRPEGGSNAAEGPCFAVTVGAYRGDWWQAAHLYRDWALGQKWCAKGPIAKRTDFPKKAADTHVWIIGGGRTNVAARTFSAMAEVWPDVGTCLTWSEWAEVSGGRDEGARAVG